MANLIIDIGNTALKAARAEGMTLGKTVRYQGEKHIDFILNLVRKERPDVMVVSCVYDLSKRDEERLGGACGRLVLLDGSHRELLRRRNIPDWLSADRAAAVLAARYLFRGRGVLVFDIGTTLTVDCLDAAGNYLGGNISPGLRTRLKALNRYSRALPRVEIPEETGEWGDSTEASISAGVVSGIMFEIEGYIKNNPESTVVFTGGDAFYFVKKMKNSIFAVCNLVLMGLALTAGEYAEKTDS